MRARGWANPRVAWAVAAGAVGAAAGGIVAGELTGGSVVLPPPVQLVVFAGLLFAAENSGVLLSSAVAASPSDLVMIASVTAFASSGASRPGVVAAAGLVGLAGGFAVETLRARRFDAFAASAVQYGLAGAVAAAAFETLARSDAAGWLLVAGLAATATFTGVNVVATLAWTIARRGQSFRVVWPDIRVALPSAVGLGMLGVLTGRLYSIGPLALTLLVAPLVVGRWTYRSYLRLRDGYEAAIGVLVNAIDAKDRYTAGHSERVARFATYIGEELGFSPADLERLRIAALLHDIGKLAVPSRLLNKPGRLTPEEYAQVQLHNRAAMEILGRIDFLAAAVPVAADRHAHFDRDTDRDDPWAMTGYAVAVADAFDAMTSTRAYRRALDQDVAFAELRDKAGSQFHPACVDALIAAIERRGERHGAGHERDTVEWETPPPERGLGSAGLGDLLPSPGSAVGP
jgi:putative nucleotidyltransferase with HDIG domain